jgi:hypothetical protein
LDNPVLFFSLLTRASHESHKGIIKGQKDPFLHFADPWQPFCCRLFFDIHIFFRALFREMCNFRADLTRLFAEYPGFKKNHFLFTGRLFEAI